MELPTFTHPHFPTALFDDTHNTWMGNRRANTIRGVVNLLKVKGHAWPRILFKTYHLPSASYSFSFHCASGSLVHKSRAAESLFEIGLPHSRWPRSQSGAHESTKQDEQVAQAYKSTMTVPWIIAHIPRDPTKVLPTSS